MNEKQVYRETDSDGEVSFEVAVGDAVRFEYGPPSKASQTIRGVVRSIEDGTVYLSVPNRERDIAWTPKSTFQRFASVPDGATDRGDARRLGRLESKRVLFK